MKEEFDVWDNGVHFTEEEFQVVQKTLEDLKKKAGEFKDESLVRMLRWMYDQEPHFKKIPDLSMHDPHQGYIYIIRHPFPAQKEDIIFVGSSQAPYEAVIKHLEGSHVAKMRAFWHALKKSHPEAEYAIHGREMLFKFEGDEIDLESPEYKIPEGFTEIPWEVIDYAKSVHSRQAPQVVGPRKVLLGSLREYYTNLYRNDGHKLINGKAGRPKKSG